MSNVLLITSSPRGRSSFSTKYGLELAQGITQKTGGTLTHRDLVASPAPHIGPAYIEGRLKPQDEQSVEEREAVGHARGLVEELVAADVIVLASGVMNFGPPSQLKAWIDNVTWPGMTFTYQGGAPAGLLSGKKVYLIAASGGIFSDPSFAPADFQTNYLVHLLGFIGLSDVELVRIEGTLMSSEQAAAAAETTESRISSLLDQAA